jgi:hypothetical protein
VRYNGLKNLDKNSGGFVSKSGMIKTLKSTAINTPMIR